MSNESSRDWGQSQVNPSQEWVQSQVRKQPPNRLVDGIEPNFLQRLQAWLDTCFGRAVARDRTIRNHRFFEEACELVQSTGMSRYECHALVDEIFNRAKGVPRQEVGGVGTTLGALCLAWEIPMLVAFDEELEAVWNRIPKIQARQKQKLKPLPGDPPAGAFVVIDYTNYKGERRLRTIAPRYMRFGTSQHHTEPQWLLEAVDIDKEAPRTFALRDVQSWTPVPWDSPLPQIPGYQPIA